MQGPRSLRSSPSLPHLRCLTLAASPSHAGLTLATRWPHPPTLASHLIPLLRTAHSRVVALGFARVINFSRSNLTNFRCNLASEKQFFVPAWYVHVRELYKKLIERRVMMKIFHTFLRHPSPHARAPMVPAQVTKTSREPNIKFRPNLVRQ